MLLLSSLVFLSCIVFSCLVLSCIVFSCLVSLSLSLSVSVCLCLSLSLSPCVVVCCVVLCGVCRCGRGVVGGRGVCVCVCVSLCVFVCVAAREKNVCGFKNASVCALKTSPCMPAPRAHVSTCARGAGTHGDVLNGPTGAGVIGSSAHQNLPTYGHHVLQRFTKETDGSYTFSV